MIELGATIKHLREAKGLTQRAAAEVLGISDVHMCNLEHNKARPSADLLATIHRAWQVDVYVLSWCLHGDPAKLPKAVRKPMSQLARAWKSELRKKSIL